MDRTIHKVHMSYTHIYTISITKHQIHNPKYSIPNTKSHIQMLGFLKIAIENTPKLITNYDAVSANVLIWVLKMGENESGQMVSEKVKWA